MWPNAGRFWLALSPQDFSGGGLTASPECAAWWEASSSAPSLPGLLYKGELVGDFPQTFPRAALTHRIPCSSGTLLRSLRHRRLSKPTEAAHWP